MKPLLVLAEFVCSESGDVEFVRIRRHECRADPDSGGVMPRVVGRRREGGGAFSMLFWLAVLGGAAGLFAFFFFTSAAARPGPSTQATPFMVERGATGASVAAALYPMRIVSVLPIAATLRREVVS